jgi:hypothetical protein
MQILKSVRTLFWVALLGAGLMACTSYSYQPGGWGGGGVNVNRSWNGTYNGFHGGGWGNAGGWHGGGGNFYHPGRI